MDFTSTESRAQNKPAIRRTLNLVFRGRWHAALSRYHLSPASLFCEESRSMCPSGCACWRFDGPHTAYSDSNAPIKIRRLGTREKVHVGRAQFGCSAIYNSRSQVKVRVCKFRDSMDSTGVHVEDSSLPSDNCSLGSSRASKPAMAKRSHAICLHRGDNSDENVAASKRARFGATNMSKPKCIDDKTLLMGVPAEAENGDIGISSDENPELCSLDYRRCSSEDKDHSADDSWIDDIFFKESVRKKLQFLSYMVGMDCSNPVEVLSEVVRVLKELNGGWWSNSRES